VNNTIDWAIHYAVFNGSHNKVPDSCCVVENKGCGDPYKFTNGTIINGIYTKVSGSKYSENFPKTFPVLVSSAGVNIQVGIA
jgi:hypothetical protein